VLRYMVAGTIASREPGREDASSRAPLLPSRECTSEPAEYSAPCAPCAVCHRVTLGGSAASIFRPSCTQKGAKTQCPSRHTRCSIPLHAKRHRRHGPRPLRVRVLLAGRERGRRHERRSALCSQSERRQTISYAPNSFVIGNAYPSWTDDVQGNPQFESGPGNPKGVSYRWDSSTARASIAARGSTTSARPARPTRTPAAAALRSRSTRRTSSRRTPAAFTTRTPGMVAHAHALCRGRVQRSNRVRQRRSLEGPATPDNFSARSPMGARCSGATCRAMGSGSSCATDEDGSATEPNWYFVHRGCVSLENKNEMSAPVAFLRAPRSMRGAWARID